MRDIDDLTNGNAEFVDDDSLLVQLPDGTKAVLDTSTGKTSPVPPGQVFWCIGGQTFKVKAGDWLLIPPDTPHQPKPDVGGFSYMIMKLNVGVYPWSLVR